MKYGWIITKDYLVDTNGKSRVGTTGPHGTPFSAGNIRAQGQFFRMKDDDGGLCYDGYFLGDENSEDAFGPLEDFGTPDVGATEIWYKNHGTGKLEQL